MYWACTESLFCSRFLLGMYLVCNGFLLDMHWVCAGSVLYWACTGFVLGMCRVCSIHWVFTGFLLNLCGVGIATESLYWLSIGPLGFRRIYWACAVSVLYWVCVCTRILLGIYTGHVLVFYWVCTAPFLCIYCVCTGSVIISLYWKTRNQTENERDLGQQLIFWRSSRSVRFFRSVSPSRDFAKTRKVLF